MTTQQQAVINYYSERTYQTIARETGISMYRVRKTLQGEPTQCDLDFLTDYMGWEIIARASAPKPVKAVYFTHDMVAIQKRLKRYYKGRSYNLIAKQTGLSVFKIKRAFTKKTGLTHLHNLANYAEWEKSVKQTAPKPPAAKSHRW